MFPLFPFQSPFAQKCLQDLTEGTPGLALPAPCSSRWVFHPDFLFPRGGMGHGKVPGWGRKRSLPGLPTCGLVLCQRNSKQPAAEAQRPAREAVGAQREGSAASQAGTPGDRPAWRRLLSCLQLLFLSPALQSLPVYHSWDCQAPGQRCPGLFSNSGLWYSTLASWHQQITPRRAAYSLSSPGKGASHRKPLAAGPSPPACLTQSSARSLADVKSSQPSCIIPSPSEPV